MTQESSQAVTEQTNAKAAKKNGAAKPNQGRVLRDPRDIASLVLLQLNAVNGKKDELTIAIKGLADTTNQLVQAYAHHMQTIAKLEQRVKELEQKSN